MSLTALCMTGLIWLAQPAPEVEQPPTGTVSLDDPAQDEKELSRREVDRALVKLFAVKDYDGAKALIERAMKVRPKDFTLHYNLACAHALTGKIEEANDSLERALSYGFVDFHELERDEHLAAIRETAQYRAIMGAWGELLDARGDANLGAMKEVFGTTYTFEKDPALRLMYASGVEAGSFGSAKQEIARVSRWAEAELFGRASDDVMRPDPWVSVILPTPTDFFRLIMAEGVGGIYDPRLKRLIAQDIGPTLRHEYLHVLHWRDLMRRGQSEHPLWVMEGLACLVEELEPSGEIAPSWRSNIAKRLERGGKLIPLERFTTMTREQFMNLRPRATYAQARAVFMYLRSQGKLKDWYAAYVKGYDKDPTGARALEEVFGEKLPAIDKRLRFWLRDLPEVAEVHKPGEATLGVELAPGSGDGPVVLNSALLGKSGEDRLRKRDIIESIDGRATRNLDDLARVLGEYALGDEVRVAVRRGSRRLEVRVQLVPESPEERMLP